MIDDTDAKILTILQEHGRTSNAELARQVRKRFGGVKAISSTRTIIVLNTIKETTALVIGGPATQTDGHD